jgi:hypothetical protein
MRLSVHDAPPRAQVYSEELIDFKLQRCRRATRAAPGPWGEDSHGR